MRSKSVRSDENGGLAAKRIEPNLDNPANRKRLVCGRTTISRALLSCSASCSDGWKAAADLSRLAIQFAPTTRLRKAIPWPKLAVSHLYNLKYPADSTSHPQSTPTGNQPIKRHTQRGLTSYSQQPVNRRKRTSPPNSNMKSRASLVTEGKGKIPNTKSGG